MKYTIDSSVQRKFDFSAATEAITESYIRMGDAYEQVVAVEGRIAEIETAMDNCKCAVQAIEKFGVTATTMSVFNGSNELDDALGLEHLDIAAVESLGQSVKKVRQQQYTAGLEGKVGEYWDKIVKWLKDFWAKVKRWFAELFERNARVIRLVNEAKAAGVFKQLANSDKKAKMLSPDQVNKLISAALTLDVIISNDGEATQANLAKLAAVGIKQGEGGKLVKTEDFATLNARKEVAIKDWASTAEVRASELGKCMVGSDVKKMAADVEKKFAAAIKDAEAAAKATPTDAAAADKAQKTRAAVVRANSAAVLYSALVGMAGNALVTLANYGKSATKAA